MWQKIKSFLLELEDLFTIKRDTVTHDYTTPVAPDLPPTAPLPVKLTIMTNADKLVASTKKLLGHNLSEGTGVPYYVACAISVNKVHQDAFGFPIGGGASTSELYKALQSSKYFELVTTSNPGCVIISPTGTGTKPAYPHGHVGLIANFGICSNDSSTGIFSENYKDINDWKHQFGDIEGYPTFLFKRI